MSGLRDRIVEHLDRASERQRQLLDQIGDDDLERQVSPIMSPICWDTAHMAHYESLWLDRALTGEERHDPRLDDLYDAFAHPRAERSELGILGASEAREFTRTVRARTLDVLHALPADAFDPDAANPLLRNGFVYGMVIQHAHQHIETMLATLAIMDAPLLGTDPADRHADGPERPEEVLIDAGAATIGTDPHPWALDNERPATTVDLAAYFIDTTPVTNRSYAEFVADGGYENERWWSPQGWQWRNEANLEHPQYWSRDGDGWSLQRYGRELTLPPSEPVQHVCWYEADAYARWRGRRLPTEAEWERAARGADTETAVLATMPERLGPGSGCPPPATPEGVVGAIGGVWEWTSSDFEAYPGFEAFPYAEYSEVFFGDEYKVLRGGSWATDHSAVRTTFRNWDLPIRRQIFSGFRCARDAADRTPD